MTEYSTSLDGRAIQNGMGAVFGSDKLSRLWDRHYIAYKDINPAVDVAAALENMDHFDLKDDPELLSFLLKFCKTEFAALGEAKPGDSEDVRNARQMTEVFHDYLTKKAEGIELPSRDDLPDTYKSYLSMMERETGQGRFRPMRGFINIMKHIGEHVNEHRREHPWGFRTLVVGALGYLTLVYAKVGSSATIYTDPEMYTIENVSLDDIADPNWIPQKNPDLFTLDIQPSCHDHIKQMFSLLGDNASSFIANGVRDTLDMGGMFPQHCSKVKNLAEMAQERAAGLYDFWNTRLGIFIHDGQASFAHTTLPDGSFKDGFTLGADYMAEGIYAGNTFENIVLHGMICLTSYAMTVKLGTMDDEESNEAKTEIKNFANRTIKNVPLSYMFGATGAVAGYTQSQQLFSPETVWMGIGGAVGGYLIHKTAKAWQKQKTAANWMSVSKDFVKNELDMLKTLVSDIRAGDPVDGARTLSTVSPWKKNSVKIATGLTAAFVAADALTTGGYTSGLVSGGTSVLVPFLGINVVEDTTAHFIFGIGGATMGMIHVGVQKWGIPGVVNSVKYGYNKIPKPARDFAIVAGRKIAEPPNKAVKFIGQSVTKATGAATGYMGKKISQSLGLAGTFAKAAGRVMVIPAKILPEIVRNKALNAGAATADSLRDTYTSVRSFFGSGKDHEENNIHRRYAQELAQIQTSLAPAAE